MVVQIDYDGSFSQWAELKFDELQRLLETKEGYNFLRQGLVRARASGISEAIISIKDNIVVHIKQSTRIIKINQVTLCIGFPFPIVVRDVEFKTYDLCSEDYEISIHLHLYSLHDQQRKFLIRCLNVISFDTKIIFLSARNFKKKFDSIMGERFDLVYYHDPFHFVGDSICHLRNLDEFLQHLKFNDIRLSTCNKGVTSYHDFENLDFVPLLSLLESLECLNIFAILPNYIDDQFIFVTNIIYTLLQNRHIKKTVIAIPGRNMFIRREELSLEVYYIPGKDVILWEYPIEEMISNSIKHFVTIKAFAKSVPDLRYETPNLPIIFINPFSSNPQKDLSVSLVRGIEYCLKSVMDCEILICGGFKDYHLHAEWRQEYTRMASKSEFYFLGPLDDLVKQVVDASFVITADTAVAHIAARVKSPNLVIYNRDFWDSMSWGSLMHHSPLGFCYNDYYQIPFITDNSEIEGHFLSELITDIVNCVLVYLNPRLLPKLERDYVVSCTKKIKGIQKGGSKNKEIELYNSILLGFEESQEPLITWVSRWRICEILPALSSDNNTESQRVKILQKFLKLSPVLKLGEFLLHQPI